MNSLKTSDQEDDRYETEEYLVYVDLDTKLSHDQLSKTNAKIKFLGIDTEHPIMQLNNQLFKGNYEYSMGTNCFFAESKRATGTEDVCFQELPEKLYEYLAKTNKILKMKRIFVEEKETTASDGLADGEIEDLQHLKISKTYEEALNQFLKPGEKPPREIINPSESCTEEHPIEESLNEEYPVDGASNEEFPVEEPSEDSESTTLMTPTKLEAALQNEFKLLTNIDFEQN